MLARFWDQYAIALSRAVAAAPADYALRDGETASEYAGRVAPKMRAAVETGPRPDFGRVNYRTSTFRKAAATVNVPFTREGLNSLYKGQQ